MRVRERVRVRVMIRVRVRVRVMLRVRVRVMNRVRVRVRVEGKVLISAKVSATCASDALSARSTSLFCASSSEGCPISSGTAIMCSSRTAKASSAAPRHTCDCAKSARLVRVRGRGRGRGRVGVRLAARPRS